MSFHFGGKLEIGGNCHLSGGERLDFLSLRWSKLLKGSM